MRQRRAGLSLTLACGLTVLACGEERACPPLGPRDGVNVEMDIREEFPDAYKTRLCAQGVCGGGLVGHGIQSFGVTEVPPQTEGEVKVTLVILDESRKELARLSTVAEIRESQPFGPECPTEHSANLTYDSSTGQLVQES